MLAHRGYELLDERECRDLLGLNSVGRIGLSIGALPAIFPVHYVLDGDSIVFRTATGTQLAESTGRGVVAFETGHVDSEGGEGWSVLAVGLPRAVGEARGQAGAAGDRLFRLAIEMISGTRLATGGGHLHAA